MHAKNNKLSNNFNRNIKIRSDSKSRKNNINKNFLKKNFINNAQDS